MKPELDIETRMNRRNMTNTQIKNQTNVMEGVVVNNFIKDNTLNDTYDTLVISEHIKMPKKIYETEARKEKGLIPLCLGALITMGSIFGGSKLISELSKPEKNKLPGLTRNHCINDELHQGIFSMIHSPNKKTILACAGVIALSATAFLGKMFIDGCRDIWIKKKEADIQKRLQENLIAVEAQCFAGKIQIIRSLLSQKAKQFSLDLSENNEKVNSTGNINFKNHKIASEKTDNILSVIIAIGTLAGIGILGYMSMKNLRKHSENIQQGLQNAHAQLDKLVTEINKTPENKTRLKDLEGILESMWAEPELIKQTIEKLNISPSEQNKLIQEFTENICTPIEQVNNVMGGSGRNKITYFSHVNEYLSFFYDWLMNSDNKQFRNLFLGISSISGLSYIGKNTFEAVKEVQVKKYAADIELELQQRLVATELRNFKAKKDAAIEPLCQEFYTQKVNGKSKEELKIIADNILFEIKNGPPFVYS